MSYFIFLRQHIIIPINLLPLAAYKLMGLCQLLQLITL